MQNENEDESSNAANRRRKTRRENAAENRNKMSENKEGNCKESEDYSSKNDSSCCKSTQHETALKRFKNKMLRKSSRDKTAGTSGMAARQNSSSIPQTFEENDAFEGQHVYEVPDVPNVNVGATYMTNDRQENGQAKGNHSHAVPRLMSRNQRQSEGNNRAVLPVKNGSVKFNGRPNEILENFSNKSAKSRQERFQQGKSMSLPDRSAPSRPWERRVPLPSLTLNTPTFHGESSEDSSSDDFVLPPPPAKDDQRSMRTQSLPSPSKLNRNYQFLNGLNDLCKCGWYWGPLSSKEAEIKLAGKPNGAFLVRDSNDNHYLLSLSFRSAQKTLHTRIEFCKGKFSFYGAPFIRAGSFASVVELIDNCVETSKERVYCYTKGQAVNSATFPVRLTKPLSRFEHVCTLQHLCRFVIRQHFTLENIGDMPLPGVMKHYLGKNHFDAKPSDDFF